MTKHVFVTGGVVSSLGKGITAASLGRLLKSRGYKVTMQKADPYLNVDPGTMSPFQHGEVFVTEDGYESDLDLGHYERFIDENLTRDSNFTTGAIYKSLIARERRGDFLGGMIKRVAIARAIVMNPRYLFCDEPNSGLDPQTSIVIDNLIHEITQEYGITTIINTHDMNSVMEIGEKIVYIYDGRKWWEGTKDDILHADNRELNDFVFASAMAKRAKLAAQ